LRTTGAVFANSPDQAVDERRVSPGARHRPLSRPRREVNAQAWRVVGRQGTPPNRRQTGRFFTCGVSRGITWRWPPPVCDRGHRPTNRNGRGPRTGYRKHLQYQACFFAREVCPNPGIAGLVRRLVDCLAAIDRDADRYTFRRGAFHLPVRVEHPALSPVTKVWARHPRRIAIREEATSESCSGSTWARWPLAAIIALGYSGQTTTPTSSRNRQFPFCYGRFDRRPSLFGAP